MGLHTHEDEITPHTRPPADDDADHMLVRTVECLEGPVEVEIVCEPAFDYGRTPAEWTMVEGRHTADATGAGQTIRLRSDLALGVEGSRIRGRHVLAPGERAYCALSWSEGLAVPEDVEAAAAKIAATTRFWRAWLSRARIPDHRWRDPIQRSALAIKGLTYMPTGATVAAATTSLPETPGGNGTGTTATRGCATPRSRSRRCTGSTSTGRPTSSWSSSPTSSRRGRVAPDHAGSTAGAT
jgi:GH15 family glucan-1,4-alpha-glucosidase